MQMEKKEKEMNIETIWMLKGLSKRLEETPIGEHIVMVILGFFCVSKGGYILGSLSL